MDTTWRWTKNVDKERDRWKKLVSKCPTVNQRNEVWSPVSIQTQSLALRALRNRKPQETQRKRLRWQAANHGCHCFDRAFLLAGACVCCVNCQRKRLRLNGNRASRSTSCVTSLTIYTATSDISGPILVERWQVAKLIVCVCRPCNAPYHNALETTDPRDLAVKNIRLCKNSEKLYFSEIYSTGKDQKNAGSHILTIEAFLPQIKFQ